MLIKKPSTSLHAVCKCDLWHKVMKLYQCKTNVKMPKPSQVVNHN